MKKVVIAGRDRTADVGAQIVRDAEARQRAEASFASRLHRAPLALAGAADESDFAGRFLDLMRCRNHIDTASFPIPRKPGRVGRILAAVRAVLWKALRYQHDRVAFQQNAINAELTLALEFLRAEYSREVRALEGRVEELERRRGGPGAAATP